MRNHIFLKCFYILAAIILVFNVVASLCDDVFYSIDDVPDGTKLTEFVSPEKDKKIEVFTVKSCLGMAVRAQYVKLDGSEESKNIYWQTDTDIVQVAWEPNNIVVNINGVRLNVEGDYVYDSRQGTSIFREGSFEGIAETMGLGH